MAKKDLSHAKGLDALFNSAPPISREESSRPKTVAKKKASPPKKVAKKVVEPQVEEKMAVEEEILDDIQEAPQKKVSKGRKKPASDKQQLFSVNLESVRERKIEYTGIRLKKDLFQRLESIAKREKLKSTNSLIALVLEAYCDGYEG
ncbi:MAG: hypothetical protein AAFR87_06010 [Bacteroidota bacterium]